MTVMCLKYVAAEEYLTRRVRLEGVLVVEGPVVTVTVNRCS
jgi:hypothetical protein